jgi:hypothetical protein
MHALDLDRVYPAHYPGARLAGDYNGMDRQRSGLASVALLPALALISTLLVMVLLRMIIGILPGCLSDSRCALPELNLNLNHNCSFQKPNSRGGEKENLSHG